MKHSPSDLKWMRRALELAYKGEGWTRPNPAVGAVIVKSGKILGEGWHHRAGRPHAEIEAIRQAKKNGHALKGATLYVTLEPCCTHGRTPPCTDAIQRERFARVVVGATDPNPAHAGKGFAILKKAGISVTHGVLAEESAFLNRSFNHWITTGRPWVVAKAALTLDGFLSNPASAERWLTSAQARKDVHRLRATCDAILVGAGTVRSDDPLLTTRGVRCLRQPLRVVLTRSGKIPQTAKVFGGEAETAVYKNLPLRKVLSDLGKRGVSKLLVEGGQEVFEGFVRGQWINELQLYFAPVLVGKIKNPPANAKVLLKVPAELWKTRTFGDDLRLSLLAQKAR